MFSHKIPSTTILHQQSHWLFGYSFLFFQISTGSFMYGAASITLWAVPVKVKNNQIYLCSMHYIFKIKQIVSMYMYSWTNERFYYYVKTRRTELAAIYLSVINSVYNWIKTCSVKKWIISGSAVTMCTQITAASRSNIFQFAFVKS